MNRKLFNRKLSLGVAAVTLTVALGSTATAATLPDGIKTGASPQSSGALVTLAIPSIVGVNVGHNFVLDFKNGAGCYGAGGATTFPQAASGTTTYNFAVTVTATDPATTNVACPGAGSQVAVATVQVFSTYTTTSRLGTGIVDGGQGAASSAFTALIADIFSASRLKLTKIAGTCGGGSVTSPHTMSVATTDYVTGIPKTGWSDCTQTLSLSLDAGTTVGNGTATGTLTFTMTSP